MCAQYELLALKYSPRFVRKCCISYIKMLLTPSAIFKFGYVWEVSIDARMKSVWGVVSKKGGAGSNPEDWAVTGYLRNMALLPLLQATRLSKLRRSVFVKFMIADNIQVQVPVLFMSMLMLLLTFLFMFMPMLILVLIFHWYCTH